MATTSCTVYGVTIVTSLILVVCGNEDLSLQLPSSGYPNKYPKAIQGTFPGYPSRYRGYPANWGAGRYPQQHIGYPAGSNEYSGTDNRYPENGNGYQTSKNMYPGSNNAFVNNDLISSDLSPTSTGYPQNSFAGYGYQQGGMGYANYGYPMISASPNDVLNGKLVNPWDAALWDHPLDPDVCRTLAGLTRAQIHICTRNTDLAGAAAIGLALAVRECKRQFAHHRWNCTALTTPTNNPHTAPIMARGYSESAFGHAITAAGVTHSISRACAAGRLQSCSCGMVGGKRSWKWSGCHDNTKFGARYSRKFLDIRERAKDIISFTHLYNNEVGRKVVRRNREVRCKCHGMSGSCEIRTCWKAAPDFRFVGDTLKEKYMNAKVAAVEVFGNSANTAKKFRPVRKEISIDSPLLYVERSPTYCSVDDRLDIPGTLGRHCNVSSTGPDSCDSLCCGRGYDQRRQKVTRKCHCRFKWCCHVTCRDCSEDRWIAVCK
ncbi:protein Wnt-4-like isoform X1 [Macrobrachium rosenbergii]|uniref:protein Wnt-4-like isoform X1 n=2 Tax=Macrobrachium rosenbergii TaxID=79674 RepID=UPI0034D7393F